MRLVSCDNGSPATGAQISAMEFAAVKEFRGKIKNHRLQMIHGRLALMEMLGSAEGRLAVALANAEGYGEAVRP